MGTLFEDFVALQARLLAPGGCPWDREQTHESLRTYLVEETYEVLDAIDSGETRHLAEELGDVLLQVVFHSQLAANAGRFDISDVIEHIHSKMVRRHPHVFGEAKASTADQVVKNWEELKAAERKADGAAQGNQSKMTNAASLLEGVSRSQPALMEANQLTRRAARVGFDWPDVAGLFEKLSEETAELKQAILSGDSTAREEEIGDLLFVGVNLARFLGIDPEIALKKANRKFSQRFRAMEALSSQAGKSMASMTLDELESLWNQVKAQAETGTAVKSPANGSIKVQTS